MRYFFMHVDHQYHLFKLLKADPALSTYHVLIYEPVSELPDKNNINELDIMVHHAPVDQNTKKSIQQFEKASVIDPAHLAPKEFLMKAKKLSGQI